MNSQLFCVLKKNEVAQKVAWYGRMLQLSIDE